MATFRAMVYMMLAAGIAAASYGILHILWFETHGASVFGIVWTELKSLENEALKYLVLMIATCALAWMLLLFQRSILAGRRRADAWLPFLQGGALLLLAYYFHATNFWPSLHHEWGLLALEVPVGTEVNWWRTWYNRGLLAIPVAVLIIIQAIQIRRMESAAVGTGSADLHPADDA